MSTIALDQIKHSLINDLNRIIELSKKLNLVIEISLNPKEPLAMGNYDMVPSVHEALESQFQLLSEEDVNAAADYLRILKRQAGFFPWINNTYLFCEKINNYPAPIGVVSEDVYLKFTNKPPKIESENDVSNNNNSESS